MTGRKAIIMGATSGMGREIALQLQGRGWEIGVTGRRTDELERLRQTDPSHIHTKMIDVTLPDAPTRLMELIDEMGGIDLYLHSSGFGRQNTQLDAEVERQTVLTNALGFTQMIDTVFGYFRSSGRRGRIAVISSVAGTRGLGPAPSYSATKRFQWTYLEALAQLAALQHVPVSFTDIRPGFVNTDFLGGTSYPLLMEKDFVVSRILRAIEKGSRVAVIDWRYRLLCAVWQRLPRWLWERYALRGVRLP
ncbi:MAG: SDR family NAD(P)-dependent oxidoreductase [Prevotella sp.]|nr:SDR family NAD(P)-dependent oxidoreductase [Prevotella sp.]